ncbi:hypothetical protein [Rhodalgimonas zhirmunskyi]|uniref:PH domain-containing protein n=1 Tax=Rhodalgimonas zhirmunskyi TaxID=2964767 RepID=A0AAJ1U883_9RHOB|nr:hypothetical protein [Rhodoalgimonas zhirmunskyi]MDQ2095425.1 hypothetical protein [Rhodoalgimonas zhirmunskyi]
MSAPHSAPAPYRFENRGRSRCAGAVLIVVYTGLLLLVWQIDMALWIAAALAAFTLPALYEFTTDPRSGLTLDDTGLSWHSATQDGTLPLAALKSVRFDTRLDLSRRVTLLLTDGRKVRLPHAATPPAQSFEQALIARGIATERHHFMPFS